MNYVCIQPGRGGYEIIKMLGLDTSSDRAVVGNPDGEETRRMYVVTSTNPRAVVANVPISRIRLVRKEDAVAVALTHDKGVRAALINFIRNSDDHKYGVM